MTGLPPAVGELGGYINGFKFLPLLIVSLVWLRLMTWADKDAEDARLSREKTGAIHVGLWLVALVLAVLMPLYAVSLLVYVLLFGVDAAVYLAMRNKTVGLKDLKKQLSEGIKNIGKKKKEIKITASENAVVLIDRGGKSYAPPPDDAPERPAYDTVQTVLQNPIRYNAQRIDLRPTEGGSVVRYSVDGVTLEGKSVPKEQATAAIGLVKQLANLDINDRRKPQTGKMKVNTESAKHDIDVFTAGSTAGELMKLNIDFKKQYDFRVESLGFLPDQLKTVMATVAEPGGVVLLTAPDNQGQTNLAYALLKQHDAYLYNIQSLERDPPVELDSITQNKLANSAASSDESKQINWMISQQPDVTFLDRVDDPRSAIELARYAKEGKRVYITMRAPNAFDALAQWRKLIGDDKLAGSSLKLVVAERLVRTLCGACKVPYTPDPDALRKMNMSAERVDKLYQPRKEPMRDQKGNEITCTFCHGLAYQGRTGVFELFKIDAEVEQAIEAGGTANQFKGLFRKQKQRYLQEAALSRVEQGDTSVEEVLRVLRSNSSSR